MLEEITVETRWNGEITIQIFESGNIHFKAPCGMYASGNRVKVNPRLPHTEVQLWQEKREVSSSIVDDYITQRVKVKLSRLDNIDFVADE